MFNVTVLKMKDIIRYFIGIIGTILIIVIISKNFNKSSNDKRKIVQEVKNGIELLSKNSMTSCLDKTMPVIADV